MGDDTRTSREFAVVGGGIAGASAAYHLARATDDAAVTVYEQGAPGAATTARSAAFFGFYGTDAGVQMKRYGMRTYNDFFASPRASLRHERVGRLQVATTPDGADVLDRIASRDDEGDGADRKHAVGVTPLSPDEIRDRVLVPPLDAGAVERACYRPGVGYLRPRPLVREFLDRARDAGATVCAHTPVEEITVADGRATGVRTADGHHAADAVVCAAGPWNDRLLRSTGVELPLSQTLAPILELAPDRRPGYTLPIVSHVESGVYARGHERGTVLVGHSPHREHPTEYDPDAVPDVVPDDRREAMRDALATVLPDLADADAVDEWVGVRSATPDGDPAVGETRVAGLGVIAFHSSGIQLAPAAGDVVVRDLLDRGPPDYLGSFDHVSPRRF